MEQPADRSGHPDPRGTWLRELRCGYARVLRRRGRGATRLIEEERTMATETIQATDHKLYVAGEWMETGEWSEVKSPYDGTLIGRVPRGDRALVNKATDAAARAFAKGGFPQHERAAVLDRAARLVAEREDDLTMTIAAEAGKPVKTARVEAQRCVGTLEFSAAEVRTLTGEMVPMEGGAAGEGKLGIVLLVPYGVVGAISPFNFPLNLVAHKLGPAIAAGNSV